MERYFLYVSGEVVYLFHILGKKSKGGGHKIQRLGIGNFLNLPTQQSAKEIPRNGQAWKVVKWASK